MTKGSRAVNLQDRILAICVRFSNVSVIARPQNFTCIWPGSDPTAPGKFNHAGDAWYQRLSPSMRKLIGTLMM